MPLRARQSGYHHIVRVFDPFADQLRWHGAIELDGIPVAFVEVIASGDHGMLFAPSPTLTRDAFHSYWLEQHARVVRPERSGRRYRQFHADPEASRIVGEAIGLSTHGFEGTASGYMPDLPTFRAAMSNSERLAPILADERRFMDHARTSIGLSQRLPGAGDEQDYSSGPKR